jgi:hypothetical protein
MITRPLICITSAAETWPLAQPDRSPAALARRPLAVG